VQQLPGAGGYDWLDVWQRMYDAERTQAEAVTEAAFSQQADCWAPRAQQYTTVVQRTPQPDGLMQRLLPHLRPEDTVLDVGAGTGRYVPILARTVARVIAVEPSPAMRAQLEQHIVAEGLDNVEVIAATWPPATLPRADIVLSAHVVYSVREIGPFLQAMDAAAGRACYLFLMARHMNELFSPFWERFHGQVRFLLPTALETLNVLHQLGLPANMELLPRNQQLTFLDADEALDDIRRRLRLAPNPERDAAIRAAIKELLVQHADGSLTFPGKNRASAFLWWDIDRRM